jgi:Response regulator receiver domain./Bacterial regulatory helix-turn-helix proteins, AraC family.
VENLKVLIVDDEYLIRNLLKKRINWEEYGMTIVGEASNAHQALDMVDELVPDIIFTDICMPFIDGIEFSRMVIEKYPEIKIVIVTGYDEFEFARKSVKLGIADFILKPIRVSELINVINRLKKKIYEERDRNKEFEKLKQEFKQSLPFLREKFLNRLILQPLPEQEISDKCTYYNIPLADGKGNYQVAVIEIMLPKEEQTEEQSILLTMECRKKVETFFHDTENAIFTDGKNRIVIITNDDSKNFPDSCELLKTNLINSYKCFVCIGIGSKHKKLSDIYLGYKEACHALNYKVIVGKNQVVCYEDVIELGKQRYYPNEDLLEKLHFYICAGSAEHAGEVLNKILSRPFSNISQLRLAAMDIIMQCQYAAIEQRADEDNTINKETLAAILLSDNLPDLKKNLEEFVINLSNSINHKNNVKAGNLVAQVKDYIEKNLSDPNLGLASTASAFYVSPGHLGRLMKKETGQTFVEYLTNIRLKKAEMLLKTTELKGYQIGEMVGISDPHYFSILFKKNLGKSINEYRNGNKL